MQYLLWPGLCSETFALFACSDVCGKIVLRADMDVVCYQGKHADYVYYLGIPMLLVYVCGLPITAYGAVYRTNRRARKKYPHLNSKMALLKLKGHAVFGMFYSAFDSDVWWWEGTVAIRKLAIAFVGVFGTKMEGMQVHVTTLLIVVVIVITAVVRPYGKDRPTLHFLELCSLCSTWMTLWAGKIFNDYPRCEDGQGGYLWWCDAISSELCVCVLLNQSFCFLISLP